jgi:tetratricopeptide (TPR) repeat protein
MVAFYIILAVLTVIGALLFKTHIIDSIDTSPSIGCAGVLLFVVACGAMVAILLREFEGDPRSLLLLLLATLGLMAVLYSPFVSNVIGTFFTNFIYPAGGGEMESHDIAEKLTTEGRYTEAVAEYARAIEEDPENASPRIMMADAYSKAGQHELAAQTLEETLSLDLPAEQWCYVVNRLADIHARNTREPDKAIEMLDRIVQKYPETTFARYARERIARLRDCQEHNT